MIVRRIAESLRSQNWANVAIELVIVIVGVFIGIEAANWNQERQERNETRTLLSQLRVELRGFLRFLEQLDDYYATTGKFAVTADAGWRGDPSVSDEEFVIAAYQASQVTAVGNNSAVWAEIFGAGDLRNIADVEFRSNLARLMTFDYSTVSLASVSTPYREQVRKVIPDIIQNSIRLECGDRPSRDGLSFELPSSCSIDIPDQDAASTAAALRARPQLAEELRWHRAAVANQLLNVGALKRLLAQLTTQLEQA
jgi:hypothetical protein